MSNERKIQQYKIDKVEQIKKNHDWDWYLN